MTSQPMISIKTFPFRRKSLTQNDAHMQLYIYNTDTIRPAQKVWRRRNSQAFFPRKFDDF